MTRKTQDFDVTAQIMELSALQPISVTFKGKPREVHFFHRGTAEAFSDALRGISENESMKHRKQREVRLLAIVLADLHGSSRHCKRLKRKLWSYRLTRYRYSEVEAVALLEAARERIQGGKKMEALIEILNAQIQAQAELLNKPSGKENQA